MSGSLTSELLEKQSSANSPKTEYLYQLSNSPSTLASGHPQPWGVWSFILRLIPGIRRWKLENFQLAQSSSMCLQSLSLKSRHFPILSPMPKRSKLERYDWTQKLSRAHSETRDFSSSTRIWALITPHNLLGSPTLQRSTKETTPSSLGAVHISQTSSQATPWVKKLRFVDNSVITAAHSLGFSGTLSIPSFESNTFLGLAYLDLRISI